MTARGFLFQGKLWPSVLLTVLGPFWTLAIAVLTGIGLLVSVVALPLVVLGVPAFGLLGAVLVKVTGVDARWIGSVSGVAVDPLPSGKGTLWRVIAYHAARLLVAVITFAVLAPVVALGYLLTSEPLRLWLTTNPEPMFAFLHGGTKLAVAGPISFAVGAALVAVAVLACRPIAKVHCGLTESMLR
ncbi:hypothetical protein GCM10022247_54480 [Allokutzneria multivorans]|uniref:Sensor domain-containing protein n=1 Tax=Allokutzneria multivorans TaxID=1142134 RepID=A0ABP7TBV8_9PSEU